MHSQIAGKLTQAFYTTATGMSLGIWGLKHLLKQIFVVFLMLLAVPRVLADPIDYEYLDARLRLLMMRSDMMGLAVGVVENGEIRFTRGYGYTEVGGQPVTTETIFRWASLSKGLAGSLAAQLDYEGVLSLDAHMSEYRTSLKLPGFGEQKATVRDLLSHRLGLGPRANNNLLEAGRRPEEIRTSLASVKMVCPVGECFNYQNVAFDAISEVFLKVTGESFDSIARRKVFLPLGMTSATTTYSGMTRTGNYAKPHSWSTNRGVLFKDGVTLPYFDIPTAAGVSSSITDLTRFLQAQTGVKPYVFHPDALKEAQTPRVRTPVTEDKVKLYYEGVERAEYGLGWRIYHYKGHTLVGHEGVVRGMRAFILFDPELRTGVVAMWNSNVSRPTGIQFEVMDMAYGLPKRDWMRLMNR